MSPLLVAILRDIEPGAIREPRLCPQVIDVFSQPQERPPDWWMLKENTFLDLLGRERTIVVFYLTYLFLVERFPVFIENEKSFGHHCHHDRHVSPQVLLGTMNLLNKNDSPETRRRVEDDLACLATYANRNRPFYKGSHNSPTAQFLTRMDLRCTTLM